MRPHPRRARTDPSAPEAWASSDRSGFVGNHRNLRWQYEWAGLKLVNTRVLVWDDEYDEPNRQLGSIILPPDPLPIFNARPENYAIDEEPVSTRYTLDGRVRVISYWPYPQERIVSVQGNLAGVQLSLNSGTAAPPTPVPAGAPSFDFSQAADSQYLPLLGGGI